jgi:hypothetical protein
LRVDVCSMCARESRYRSGTGWYRPAGLGQINGADRTGSDRRAFLRSCTPARPYDVSGGYRRGADGTACASSNDFQSAGDSVAPARWHPLRRWSRTSQRTARTPTLGFEALTTRRKRGSRRAGHEDVVARTGQSLPAHVRTRPVQQICRLPPTVAPPHDAALASAQAETPVRRTTRVPRGRRPGQASRLRFRGREITELGDVPCGDIGASARMTPSA